MSPIFMMLGPPVVMSLVMAVSLRRRGTPWLVVISMALLLPGLVLTVFRPPFFRITGLLLATPGAVLIVRGILKGVSGGYQPPAIAPETPAEKLILQTELDDLEQNRVRMRRRTLLASVIYLVAGVILDQRFMVVSGVVMAGLAWIGTRSRKDLLPQPDGQPQLGPETQS